MRKHNLKNLFHQMGQGNFSHRGRPGLVGGSSPNGGESRSHTIDQPGLRDEKLISPFGKSKVKTKLMRMGDPGEGYYTFTKPTPIYLHGKLKGTGHYSGSSQIYQPELISATALPGDELHNIPGGTFLLRKGSKEAVPVKFEPYPDKSLFERNYGSSTTQIPLDNSTKFANIREHPNRDSFTYNVK